MRKTNSVERERLNSIQRAIERGFFIIYPTWNSDSTNCTASTFAATCFFTKCTSNSICFVLLRGIVVSLHWYCLTILLPCLHRLIEVLQTSFFFQGISSLVSHGQRNARLDQSPKAIDLRQLVVRSGLARCWFLIVDEGVNC